MICRPASQRCREGPVRYGSCDPGTETTLQAAEAAITTAAQRADAAERRAGLAEAKTRGTTVRLEIAPAATAAADQRADVAERRAGAAEQRSLEALREREAANLDARLPRQA